MRQTRRFARPGPTGGAGPAPEVPELAAATALADRGGQSLAARVVFEAARHGNRRPDESVADAARAVEMLEGAIGLHADLVDPSVVRLERERDDPVAGGLGGAWLLGAASELIAGCGDEAAAAWARTSHQLVRAQMLEFEDLYDAGRSPDRYLDVAEMRAGGLLALAAHLGALLGGSPDVDAAFREYGRELGIAREIRDDVAAIDDPAVRGGATWRLGSGDYSLPLLYAIEARPELAASLGEPLAADAVAPLIEAIRDSGALARANFECRLRAQAAKQALRGLDADGLLELADEVAEARES